MTFKVDYLTLEREYVESDISIRDLAKEHGISWSTVADQARKREWTRKRSEFLKRQSELEIENAAQRRVRQHAEFKDEALMVARAGLRRYAESLIDKPERPGITVDTRDAIGLIKSMLLLMGDATQRMESTSLGIQLNAEGIPADFFQRLAEVARERSSVGVVEGVARPLIAGPRPE